MRYRIVETKYYRATLKKVRRRIRTIEEDVGTVKKVLAVAPDQAAAIPGLEPYLVRKYRVKCQNIGKSGGPRIIFLQDDESMTLYFLFIYTHSMVGDDVSIAEYRRMVRSCLEEFPDIEPLQ